MAKRKANQAQKETQSPTQNFSAMELTGDEFVHLVAKMAWSEGLSPNEIAKRLGISDKIMQVKRALGKAVKRGILRLEIPRSEQRRRDLKETWEKPEYVVVDDSKSDQVMTVCLAAAETFLELLGKKLRDSRRDKRTVVVGVAGGYTVAQTVLLLQSMAPPIDLEDRKRLMFISLHAAVLRRRLDESANFLAVRLAEIFGGQHFAVLEHVGPGDESQKEEKEYCELVEKIDLMITGVGSTKSLVGRHAEESNIPIPPEMVGDLAYIPLDAEGRWVEDPDLNEALAKVRPHPSYAELQRLRLRGMDVLTIAGVFAHGMDSKLGITRAVFRAALASHCVLGESFARRLIEFGDNS